VTNPAPNYLKLLSLPSPIGDSKQNASSQRTERILTKNRTHPHKEQNASSQRTERILTKKGLREFLVVDHTANVRKNSKISAIWHHGGERRRLDDKSLHRYWRCAYCIGSATVLKVDGNCGGQTTYALAQLRNALGPQIIEACECLRWWWRNRVVTAGCRRVL
jgi:hypothetical protein